MKPLGDAFIRLIQMIIAPIIFCTVVSTLAVVNLAQPGAGMYINATTLDQSAVKAYAGPGKMKGTVDFLLDIIPTTFLDAFTKGEILQVLLLAVLTGLALQVCGGRANIVFQFSGAGIRGAVQDCGPDDEGGSAGRVRRDGVHHRQL